MHSTQQKMFVYLYKYLYTSVQLTMEYYVLRMFMNITQHKTPPWSMGKLVSAPGNVCFDLEASL